MKKLFGVGKVTAARLHALGVDTCGDLRAWGQAELVAEFGSFGASLYRLCRGEDTRAVKPDRVRKSLSVETTYVEDLPDMEACLVALPALVADFERRFARLDGTQAVAKVFVKVKFADFSQTTVERSATAPDAGLWPALLGEAHARRGQAVRLLGIGVRFAERQEGDAQLALFAEADGE